MAGAAAKGIAKAPRLAQPHGSSRPQWMPVPCRDVETHINRSIDRSINRHKPAWMNQSEASDCRPMWPRNDRTPSMSIGRRVRTARRTPSAGYGWPDRPNEAKRTLESDPKPFFVSRTCDDGLTVRDMAHTRQRAAPSKIVVRSTDGLINRSTHPQFHRCGPNAAAKAPAVACWCAGGPFDRPHTRHGAPHTTTAAP